MPPGTLLSGNAGPASLPTNPFDEANRFEAPTVVESVDALCPVPSGWIAEPLKRGPDDRDQVWLSPSGHTGYGVLFVNLPFPAGVLPASFRLDRVLAGFLAELKKREGRANLIERRDNRDGIYFVAEGLQYRIYANVLVRGSRAWFVYAGTRRSESLVPDELAVAERARDLTRVGVSK